MLHRVFSRAGSSADVEIINVEILYYSEARKSYNPARSPGWDTGRVGLDAGQDLRLRLRIACWITWLGTLDTLVVNN